MRFIAASFRYAFVQRAGSPEPRERCPRLVRRRSFDQRRLTRLRIAIARSIVTPITRSLHAVRCGDRRHLVGIARSRSGRARALHGTAGTPAADRDSSSSSRADAAGPKRRFGQRHGQAAVAHVVGRFGQALARRSRAWPPARASRSPCRAPAAGPTAASGSALAYWVPPKRRQSHVAEAAQQHRPCGPACLKSMRHRLRRSSCSPTMPITGVG